MNENTRAERRPLEEGSRVGEYRIVRCLGSNGEGIFYLAQDCIVGDVVQLQEFFPAGIACRCDDADSLQPLAGHATEFKYFRASFQDLYRILQQEKENSCLIPIVQLFEQNATVYVASEHLQVSTLEETLRQSGGRQCWCRAKKYLLPLYNSLSSLHKKGITHQGISPENILLDEENRVYWRGFSLLEMRTATGEMEPQLFAGYSAPEQYQPESWRGGWTDLYSIAAVTYRVLTGVVVPDAAVRQQQDRLMEPILLDERIPQNISDALYRALALKPEERFDSMDAFIAAMLEETTSNTAVFTVEQPTLTDRTVHLDTVHFQPQESTAVLPPKEELLEEQPKPHPPQEKTRMKKGSFYLVVTMAATLLVLALGTPRLIRAISSNWNQASEPASQQEQNVQISSGTEQQQHKVDNFIGKKASEVLSSDQFEPWYYFETVEQYSEEFAKGVVANQSIQSGTTIGRKTTITLYVSKGSASEPLPQLVGKTPEEAIAILGEMNKQYKIINGSSQAVDEGKIFRTDPQAGTQMKKDNNDVVLLYVAQGEQEQPKEEDSSDSQNNKTSGTTGEGGRKVLRKWEK